jgi:CxxC motif-containing protein (DUF1111 family)
LTLEELISAGRRKFQEPWSLRNEIDGVWGLGPTFNEMACPQCHQKGGRSAAPGDGHEAQHGMVIRLSVPGRAPEGGPLPHPNYGDQLQNRGIAQRVPREGQAFVSYRKREVNFVDGETISLRQPQIMLTNLQFGELRDDTMISARSAPMLFGLGLLEAVPERAILALAQRQQHELSGISGKPNYVWDVEAGKSVLGRFGWKANQPTLRQQVAAALLNDIGATSTLYPVDNCPSVQTLCRTDPTTTDCGGLNGGCAGNLLAEVLPSRLRTITLYIQSLQVPARTNVLSPSQRQRGEQLFAQAQCAGCHVPELETGENTAILALARAPVRAYTDLLLHDMGEELADHRPDFLADGREWRTAPLWGLGLLPEINGHTDLLHDGRARNITEAILWHGGEAETAREAFRRMSKDERGLLVRFVETL